MSYSATIRAERFVFADLREVFAKANEEKSGDRLALNASAWPPNASWLRSASLIS